MENGDPTFRCFIATTRICWDTTRTGWVPWHQRVGFFPVGLDRFEKGNQQVGSVPWWIKPILCQQNREDHLNCIYIYIYSYPNLNVLLRPSFFFGLFLRQVRCFVPRILVAFFIPRSEVNGRVAVLQSWNLHLGSKQSGGEWWNMKTNWDETLLAEERKGTNFAKWCVYYLLDFFFSDVCFGMVWIREESHCGKTPWNFPSFWPCIFRTLKRQPVWSCWRIQNLQCQVSCSESGAWKRD